MCSWGEVLYFACGTLTPESGVEMLEFPVLEWLGEADPDWRVKCNSLWGLFDK